MTTLFINIKNLVGVREANALLRGDALAYLPSIPNAFLLVEDGI
ncbi:MAG: imidazolonepropionase, partial [Chitinophagaceae bacterium]